MRFKDLEGTNSELIIETILRFLQTLHKKLFLRKVL